MTNYALKNTEYKQCSKDTRRHNQNGSNVIRIRTYDGKVIHVDKEVYARKARATRLAVLDSWKRRLGNVCSSVAMKIFNALAFMACSTALLSIIAAATALVYLACIAILGNY